MDKSNFLLFLMLFCGKILTSWLIFAIFAQKYKKNDFLRPGQFQFLYLHSQRQYYYATGIYQSKVNNRNTRTRCEICSKLTIKTPERRHCRRSSVFIVNLEHIAHLVLGVSIVNFEHIIAGWYTFSFTYSIQVNTIQVNRIFNKDQYTI